MRRLTDRSRCRWPAAVFAALIFCGVGSVRADGPDNDTCETAEEAGNAGFGLRVDGTLDEAGGDVDFYRFTTRPRRFMELRVRGLTDALDTMVAVYGSDCQTPLYFSDDFSADSADPAIRLRAPADGVLVVVVTGFPDVDFAGDHEEAGDYSIRFRKTEGLVLSNVGMCEAVPSDGGLCEIGVRVDNRSDKTFSGEAWYIVFANGLEPPWSFSTRQIDPPKGRLELAPNGFAKLNAGFKINARAPVGAEYCVEFFVAKGDLLYNVQSNEFLGCVVVQPPAPDSGELSFGRAPTRSTGLRLKRRLHAE
jgi:hypothetical protein